MVEEVLGVGDVSRSNRDEDLSFRSQLTKNHWQWIWIGVPGLPFVGLAWICHYAGATKGANFFGIWGTLFMAMAGLILPIRVVGTLIDRDDWRVVLFFVLLAAINGAPLLISIISTD